MTADPGRLTLDRAALDAAPRTLLSRGSRLKPAVHRVETAQGPCIVKDVRGLPGPTRGLARWLMNRERRVLQRLEGVDGVPQIVAEVDRDAFAVGVLPGRPLEGGDFDEDPRGLADCLQRRIRAIHARGVYHLDLRQRQNILVAGPADARLVDFGAAWRVGPVGRWLLAPVFRWVDEQAVLKFLARHAPEAMTPAEARALLRSLRWRRLWVFSPHTDRGERAAARKRAGED